MKNFTKEARLLDKDDFAYMKGAKRSYSKGLSAFYKPSRVDSEYTRIGISVSRHVSKKAVIRNKIKRKIREWFRTSKYRKRGLDVLIVAYPDIEINKIPDQLTYLFRKIKVSQ